MAEWLVEEGIAEHRAVRWDSGGIAGARIAWPGRLLAGSVVEARLVARTAGSPRGTARSECGEELLVDRLPREASEGAVLRVLVTRAALDGPGRLKRAQGRATDTSLRTPTLAQTLAADSDVRIVRRFPGGEWDELVGEALAGAIAFPGGSLLLSPTPALTTIDVDGTLGPRALALAAVPAVAGALDRLAIGGSVVIDFPTLAAREDRRALDQALGIALAGYPHERTAVNGFGLVQIVARLEGPSLLQRAAWQRAGLVWRHLLRRAEGLDGPGALELGLAPALEGMADRAHLSELERRAGRRVRVRIDAGLDPDAPHAQLVAP